MSTIRISVPLCALLLCAAPAFAQAPVPGAQPVPAAATGGEATVTLDFQKADLTDVINSMAKILKKRYVYDERVRGEVTVISEEPVTLDQARLMFESLLELKGFTIVEGPSGEQKIIPSRDAPNSPLKSTNLGDKPEESAIFVTRLIKLRYIKVDSIQDTLRQLASKDARLIGDARTNSVIVTDTGANIRRMINIVEAIDVATYEEQTKVIQLTHANATDLTAQLKEMFGGGAGNGPKSSGQANAAATAFAAARAAAAGVSPVDGGGVEAQGTTVAGGGEPRFIPDTRTNSIIVMAPQATLTEVEKMVTLLDYKRAGRGGMNIYKLKNADAEEVAETLNALAGGTTPSSSGSSSSTAGGGAAGGAALDPAAAASATAVQLEGGARVTADAATNSLIIQSTPEAYAALVDVIEELDARRPQVMIEAAMLEVQIKDGNSMGTNLVYSTLFGGDTAATQIGSNPGNVRIPGAFSNPANPTSSLFSSTILGKMVQVMDPTDPTKMINVPVVSGVITAARSDADTNIIATPKILTADNEEAQIVVGETRGFPTSQLQAVNSAGTTGMLNTQANNPFQTSTQIERQDVGVTMRITPQISEGDTVRMKIFTEISNVTDPNNPFGPTTSNRQIENTVYVKDGEAVMIGGIIQDQLDTGVNKVPFLGDIPALGWAFRSETESVVKTNLIMVLTPRIVRDPMDLQQLTVEGREKFRASAEGLEYDDMEDEERRKALEAGIDLPQDSNPVRRELQGLTNRYPTDKLPELREEKQIREEERAQKQIEGASAPAGNYLVQLALVERPEDAAALLEKLMQQGYDGVVLSREENGQTLHYVQLGPYKSESDAQRVGREVKAGTGLNTYIMIEP